MSSTIGRTVTRLATLLLLAVLVGGCGGVSASPTAAAATTVPQLDGDERARLKGISAVRTRVEHSYKPWAAGQ